MKNLNNDKSMQNNLEKTVFDNLPTAEEAERMEAEAGGANAAAFNEQAVTALTLDSMKTEAIRTSDNSKAGSAKRKGRRVLRAVLIAASLAVLLMTSLCVAAMIAYDVRFTQLIGLEGTMKELENGYVEIGISAEVGGLTVTAVDAIGDSRTQWIEFRTNYKLPDGTPDGFFNNLTMEDPAGIVISSGNRIVWSADVSYYEGSHFETLKSDTDCMQYYYDTLYRKKGVAIGFSMRPFARDGYLWYLASLTALEDVNINRGFVHVVLYCNYNGIKRWPVEFDWRNNYTAKEKSFRMNRKAGDVVITRITLTSTKMFISYDGVRKRFRLNSVTLSDGTVIPTRSADPAEITATPELSEWDGWIESGINSPADKYFRNYSLFPGESFKTPSGLTTCIPMDDIVSVNINGVDIPIK